ncbi:hypothetical protein [Prosthecomicrobium pneumaticum]|uniref:Uncharacterized protein n=1 Tax=Prosthecomicrobium pneumaticum TaxID=81895 RepID=A0A7W9FPY7_9HYPH|nr:hypothetical protein [Prosthecomicrobium pneumaticum]MBB5754638.1 hypothetical protein [Prosthecomicrobium pneumaticum]
MTVAAPHLQAMVPADPAEARRLRATIADEIERLLALLDSLDGDPDREPFLAATACEVSSGCYSSASDDREEEAEHEDDELGDEGSEGYGIADQDAMSDPEMYFGADAGWDGSGRIIAEMMLASIRGEA